jgi:2-iminobutanoate/2-iminopropanoate deaminase
LSKTEIRTDDAPKPPARFSQGVRKGNIIQVAGQVAFDAATGETVGTTVAEQTRKTFENVATVLKAGGSSLDDVVMLRVFLTDVSHFADMNGVWDEVFADSAAPPARTTVYVGLPAGLLVEIDALAVLD